MTYTVKIVETSIGYKDFNTEEEALEWMEDPENFDNITWSDCDYDLSLQLKNDY
jgi:viroplasmin and RNaseH domain-containing protein